MLRFLSCLTAALAVILLLHNSILAAETEKQPSMAVSCAAAEHWRDIAYLKPPMDRYRELKNCIAWTAYQFELPEELLYAVLYVERGEVNGKCSANTNGTLDCGPAQINEVRAGELKDFKLSMADLRHKPCHNIWAMGYLLRREIERADGHIWRGVGNYHYHYSVNPLIHERYVGRVRRAWQRLVRLSAELCPQEAAAQP